VCISFTDDLGNGAVCIRDHSPLPGKDQRVDILGLTDKKKKSKESPYVVKEKTNIHQVLLQFRNARFFWLVCHPKMGN
jgi:hypothetical protein